MTNDRVLDLSELTEVSITKTLVKEEKLMTGIEKCSHKK